MWSNLCGSRVQISKIGAKSGDFVFVCYWNKFQWSSFVPVCYLSSTQTKTFEDFFWYEQYTQIYIYIKKNTEARKTLIPGQSKKLGDISSSFSNSSLNFHQKELWSKVKNLDATKDGEASEESHCASNQTQLGHQGNLGLRNGKKQFIFQNHLHIFFDPIKSWSVKVDVDHLQL